MTGSLPAKSIWVLVALKGHSNQATSQPCDAKAPKPNRGSIQKTPRRNCNHEGFKPGHGGEQGLRPGGTCGLPGHLADIQSTDQLRKVRCGPCMSMHSLNNGECAEAYIKPELGVKVCCICYVDLNGCGKHVPAARLAEFFVSAHPKITHMFRNRPDQTWHNEQHTKNKHLMRRNDSSLPQ